MANGEPYSTNLNVTWQSFDDAVLTFSVVDQCSASDEASVNILIVNPPVVIDIGEDINASCLDNTQIDVDVIDGSGNYTYQWFVADTSYATTEDIVVQSFFTVPVGVLVTDGCGSSAFDDLLYIIPDDPIVLTVHPDTAICAGTGISIWAFAEGGEDGFHYNWTSLGAFGPDQYIAPYQSNTYSVTATDICGWSASEQVFVEVQYLFSNFTVSPTDVDNQYQFFGNPSPSCPGCQYLWDFGDGNFSDEANPLHTFDGLSDYTVSLQVTNEIGCTNTAYTLINGPVILYVPNAFTPNNDGINDVFRVYGNGIMRYEITIFNRWGEKVFQSNDINQVWDGSHKGGDYYVPNDIYHYVIKVKGFDTDAFERSGHISVMW
jgi:gliding motility-associated-like protein